MTRVVSEVDNVKQDSGEPGDHNDEEEVESSMNVGSGQFVLPEPEGRKLTPSHTFCIP